MALQSVAFEQLTKYTCFTQFIEMQTYNEPNVIYSRQDLDFRTNMNYGKFALDTFCQELQKFALINGATDEHITFGEIAQRVVNLTSSLTELGVKEGEVLSICSENREECITTMVASLCAGATVTFINTDLKHIIQLSKPKYMFLSTSVYEKLYETLENMKLINIYIVYPKTGFLISENDKLLIYNELIRKHVDIETYKLVNFDEAIQTAHIYYSSGTTGLPKGVKATHRNLITAALQPPDLNFSVPGHMNYGRCALEKILKKREKVALVNGLTKEQITYGELAQKVVNVAASLQQLGIKKSDVIAICSENRTEFLIASIAVFCSGATLTYINNAYSKNELKHTIKISKPTYMFMSPNAYEHFYDTMRTMDTIKKFFIFGTSTNKDILSFTELLQKHVDINNYEPYDFKGEVKTALILYSSGTTGLPKGAKLSHRNMIVASLRPPYASKAMTVLSLAPWCNTVGITLTMLKLLKNETLVYLNKFQEDLYLDCIQKYKVNLLLAVPPLLVILGKSKIIGNYDVSSVELMYCGGAPLSAEAMTLVKKQFSGLKHLLQGYGMTETTGAVTEETDTIVKIGSVGKIAAGNIIKIVDIETRKTLGPNQTGEICVKGLVLFEGYIGKDLKDDSDEDGFFKTGDIGYYDEDGFFFIVDRLKELIKYKAGQVAPSELEGIIQQHKKVKDVGVVGAPDPIVGELPTAFVVKHPEAIVTEKEIIDYVADKVSSWKQLRGGVRFINEIPKTASGKILRRVLRDLLTKPPNSKL